MKGFHEKSKTCRKTCRGQEGVSSHSVEYEQEVGTSV